MQNIKQNIIPLNYSLSQCIKRMSKVKIKNLFVVEHGNKLVGTISDGDIRRGILKFKTFSVKISQIMRKNFFFLKSQDKIINYKKLKNNNFLLIPILDKKKKIISIKNLDEIKLNKVKDNSVVIMAGGFGMRLRPLTLNTPKPMIRLNGKPILESIINNFRESGFGKFYISTFYKPKKILDYFKDGNKFRVKIKYLKEKKPLGTAGSLGLLPKNENKPIIVINGDILTKLNPNLLLEYHKKNKFDLTVASINYNQQLPFGSIKVRNNKITGLEEKPQLTFKVNAGIYVINPKIYKKIKKNVFISMTDLIKKLLSSNYKVGVFPIYENWGDIGDKKFLKKIKK